MTRLASPALALLLAVPLPGAAQPRPEPERGLVAAYAFDGDAVDAVTRARGGAVATRPAEDRNGVRGGALWFDGTRAAVNLGAALQPARFTLAAWIRPQAVDRVQVVISKIRNMPGHYQANLELRLDPGGRLFLHVPSGQGWEGVQGVRPIAPGRWTHVAAVYDGARAQLYVDGVADGAPLAVRYAQTPTETFVGARPEGGGADGRSAAGPVWFFFGALDDVSIWDRALGEAEIALVSGRAQAAPPPAAPPPWAQPAPPAPVPARATPIAVYALDGDARETLGGRDGAAADARPAADRAGDPRGALALGGGAHVDLGVRALPERFSLSLWLRPARASRDQVIFSQRVERAGRERWLELALRSGRAALAIPGAAGASASVAAAKRLPAARWVHLAATYDGVRAILYVDGVAAGEARLARDTLPGRALLGARPDASGRPARRSASFEGLLDDLRVFREALTPEEVALLARAGERPSPDRDDEDEAGPLLVRVGKLLVRFDAACATRDPRRMARAEEKIAAELEAAVRDARGDRTLVQQLRAVLRALEGERGQHDAVSLDRKRGALSELSDALWSELARDLDAGATWPASAEALPDRDGW